MILNNFINYINKIIIVPIIFFVIKNYGGRAEIIAPNKFDSSNYLSWFL